MTKTISNTFGVKSTTDEILEGVDLTGKRALVTGVSAGIGGGTAHALAAHGATVVGTVRDLEKGRRATAHIPDIQLIELDLASLKSVRAAADKLNVANKPFDLVIANAAAYPTGTRRLTEDGLETHFGTNYLGHFVFVNRIVSLLRPGARLVNVSSYGHSHSDVDLEDPNFDRTEYSDLAAYGRSKTALILFAVEFDRRHRARGVRAAALHPGGIQTELLRQMTPEPEIERSIALVNEDNKRAGKAPFEWKTISQGAATSVWAGVVAPADEVGGRYCEDCQVAEIVDAGPELIRGVRPYALDGERAKALWAKSEEMVGERF